MTTTTVEEGEGRAAREEGRSAPAVEAEATMKMVEEGRRGRGSLGSLSYKIYKLRS